MKNIGIVIKGTVSRVFFLYVTVDLHVKHSVTLIALDYSTHIVGLLLYSIHVYAALYLAILRLFNKNEN
jgi:hypothetical protein